MLLLLMLLSALFIYINRHTPEMAGFTKAVFGINISKAPDKILLDSSAQYVFARVSNDVVICGGEEIRAYGANGQLQWSLPLGVSRPVLSAAKGALLLADRDESEAVIISGGREKLSITSDGPIITARINKKGYFALVTKEKGYKGKITVYNSEGAAIYRWFSGSSDIIDVDISDDGRQMAVAALELDSQATGKVILFNLSEEKPFAENISQDNVLLRIKYARDGMVYAIGDSAALGYDAKGKEAWAVDYEGRSLTAIASAGDDEFALGLSGGVAAAYTHRGKLKGSYKTDGEIQYIDAANGVIVINRHRDIVLINSGGREIAKGVAGRDIRNAIIFPDKKHLLLLSGASAEIVKMGG